MTWSNHFRLLGGLIVVVAIVAGATLVLNQRENQVASGSAAINAVSYSVGSDYAGTVVTAAVKEGDTVKKSDPLMTIQSASLLRDMNASKVVPESTSYSVSKNGTITLIATEPGIVSNIRAQVGGLVGAGQRLATIDRSGPYFVLAKFRVDSYDFARVHKGATVEIVLPNHQRVNGTVSDVKVQTSGGKADAAIKVTSKQLLSGSHNGLVEPGTPVTAIMHLRDDGPLADVKDSFFSLLEQIGI
jgi:multidrug resistance efflux pump